MTPRQRPPMPADPPNPTSERFEPRAAGAMASMFDGVSGRYDLLNALMTLGQDGAWRRAMWRAVPERARVVLDLCTGNGVSLAGLTRTGRLVLGVDVSLGMLEHAASSVADFGWGPRLACADAFRLPLRPGSVDAITIAFGMRNLRPRREALAEARRVLGPGGRLVVLEATAPGPGPGGALHAFHLRHVVPLLGRLSPEPSAYGYLSASIFEFGPGESFEADLATEGFVLAERRRFLLGATRLWVAERAADGLPGAGTAAGRAFGYGEIPTAATSFVQSARPPGPAGGSSREPRPSWEGEWRAWTLGQALTSAALTVALAYGVVAFAKLNAALPLEAWQRGGLWALLVGGVAGFGLRTLVLLTRLAGPPGRR